MQPTQPSLWPDEMPTQAARLINELPEDDLAAATATLTALIAKTVRQRSDVEEEA